MYYSIDDRGASKLLVKSRPLLVHLNIRGCDKLGKPTFQAISECRNLQDLNMSNCERVNVSP